MCGGGHIPHGAKRKPAPDYSQAPALEGRSVGYFSTEKDWWSCLPLLSKGLSGASRYRGRSSISGEPGHLTEAANLARHIGTGIQLEPPIKYVFKRTFLLVDSLTAMASRTLKRRTGTLLITISFQRMTSASGFKFSMSSPLPLTAPQTPSSLMSCRTSQCC